MSEQTPPPPPGGTPPPPPPPPPSGPPGDGSLPPPPGGGWGSAPPPPPGGGYGGPGGPGGPGGFSVGNAFGYAWKKFTANAGPLVLITLILLVAVLGPGLTNAMIAIAIVYQPHFARLTRAAVMGEMRREYVTAARVAGAGNLRLMFKTILPNCLGPLIVQATLSFSSAAPIFDLIQ